MSEKQPFPIDDEICFSCRRSIGLVSPRPCQIDELVRVGYDVTFCASCAFLFEKRGDPILLRNLLMAFHASVTERPELGILRDGEMNNHGPMFEKALKGGPAMTVEKEILLKRIASDFTYHTPKPGQPETYAALRDQAKALAETFILNVPDGRELSLALTKIEEAVMWANAGIARHG